MPTLKESGVDFQGESWFAMFAPSGTPAPVVSLLRQAIAPGEQAKCLQDEVERWGALVTRYSVGVD